MEKGKSKIVRDDDAAETSRKKRHQIEPEAGPSKPGPVRSRLQQPPVYVNWNLSKAKMESDYRVVVKEEEKDEEEGGKEEEDEQEKSDDDYQGNGDKEIVNQNFNCRCNFTTKDPKELALHLSMAHKLPKVNLFKIRSEEKWESESESETETNKSNGQKECCGGSKLKMRKVGGKPKSVYNCEYCDKECVDLPTLRVHRRVHTGDRPFKCNLCGFSTAMKCNLQIHIARHLKEKLYKCCESNCKFSSVTKDELRSHQLVHIQDKPFPCSLCSFTSGTKRRLTLHQTTHQENKPFGCGFCPFQTKYQQSIALHINTVHSDVRKFKCPHDGCKYAGKAKSNLNSHLQIHRAKKLSCPHPNCAYKTNFKYALKRHGGIHSGEKKYKCGICDYKSRQAKELTAHIHMHTNETPYKCRVQGCQYATETSSSLGKHVRAVHEQRGKAT